MTCACSPQPQKEVTLFLLGIHQDPIRAGGWGQIPGGARRSAGNLADFLALVFKHLDNPESSHSGDATETILAEGYFCTRHNALMSRHITTYAVIASEALSLYDQDEADEGDIVPLTVDRFTKHLTAHNEHVSPNFRRAVSDFALLGTILHITRYTLGV